MPASSVWRSMYLIYGLNSKFLHSVLYIHIFMPFYVLFLNNLRYQPPVFEPAVPFFTAALNG